MATIPTPGSEVRHVRKTITFDGSANNGNLGDDVTVFTITGRVILERFTAYVTDSLVCAAGATTDIAFYPRSQSRLGSPASANQWSAGYWYQTEGQVDSPGTTLPAYFGGSDHAPFAMADDLTLRVENSGGGADVTAGTVIVDVWYRPITDDGALAGDDIDQDSRTWFWAQALADIAAVPAMTASALSGLNWLFALARNKRTQTATTETVYKDDGSTSLATSTKSDDGTTYTRGEYS